MAMVNGCAHQRRREETRDTKEARTRYGIYRLLCHNHNIKGAKEFDPAFYFFSFLLSSRLGAMEETKHVRKLPVQLLKNCGARQGQTRCCCCRSKQEIQLGVAHKAHGNTKQMRVFPSPFAELVVVRSVHLFRLHIALKKIRILYAVSIKFKQNKKLITQFICKLRDKFNESN